jgi:hypothetical protein
MLPPDAFYQAVEEFNRCDFFACHETLEDLWRPLPLGPRKTFYQGILQVGVGFYHLSRGNDRGARNVLRMGLKRLASLLPLPPEELDPWIDLKGLYRESEGILQSLEAGTLANRTDGFPKLVFLSR